MSVQTLPTLEKPSHDFEGDQDDKYALRLNKCPNDHILTLQFAVPQCYG